MAKAPLPDKMPGEFFVMVYDREFKEYTLFVDDATRSSYKLGSDIQAIMRYLKRIGVYDLGCRALDVAREFMTVQAVLADGRVMPIKPELPKTGLPPKRERPFAFLPGL